MQNDHFNPVLVTNPPPPSPSHSPHLSSCLLPPPFVKVSKASETFFGGATWWIIIVKIKSRVIPLVFAAKRIVKAFRIKYHGLREEQALRVKMKKKMACIHPSSSFPSFSGELRQISRDLSSAIQNSLRKRAHVGRAEYYKQVHPVLTACAFCVPFVFSLFVVIRLFAWGTCQSADPLHRICLFSAFPVLDLAPAGSGQNQACSCMQIWYEEDANRTRCNDSINVARRHEFASIAATSQYTSTVLIGYKCNETVPVVNTLFATMQRASVLIIDGHLRSPERHDEYGDVILSQFDDITPGSNALQKHVQFKHLQDVTTLNVLILIRLELDSIEWLPSMVQLREFKTFGVPLVALPRSTMAKMSQLDQFSVISAKLSALPSTVDYFPTSLTKLVFEGRVYYLTVYSNRTGPKPLSSMHGHILTSLYSLFNVSTNGGSTLLRKQIMR